MQNKFSKTLILFLLTIFFVPFFALAHQPRITEGRLTQVLDPEISKAYYGKLTGEPDVYIIKATQAFDLYVNVLVPDISGQKKDISATVFKDGAEIAHLDGPNFEWEQFYEPFGASTYWRGPEYKARSESGAYEIHVTSPGNDSKYSLAVGDIEAFDGKEGINALTLIPELKKNFFNESPISFIVSPFGWGLIVVMYVLALIFGLIYRAIAINISMLLIIRNPARRKQNKKNIGTRDRVIRVIIGLGLLLWAITTTWNPLLIFLSGFCMFEAVFSWCAFYHAIEKDTCQLE